MHSNEHSDFFFHTKYSPKRNDVTFEKITYPN